MNQLLGHSITYRIAVSPQAGPKAFASLTGHALAETSDRSIEDPAVIKQILAYLARKAESKEFNPLPESRAPPQIGLFG